MWKGVYFIFYILLQHVKSDSICRSNSIVPEKNVLISGYNNDIGQCECQITLTRNTNNHNPYNTNINITHYPVGCNYSLLYWLDGYNNKIESTYKNSTSSLDLNGTLYVRIENKLIGSGELCFTFSVTSRSPDQNISTNCENLNKPTVTTTTLSTTTVPVPITPSISQTVDTVSTGDITNTLSSSTTTSKTDQRTTMFHEKNTNNNDSDNSIILIIMGCIIGILVIILAIIITCILLKRRNHQKNRNSENPNHGTTNMAVYSSLDDNRKDSSQYGHIVRQHQCDSERTESVPGTSNEYINVKKDPLEGTNENTIEYNNKPNISKIERDYENMKERKL